jgi:ferrous iron transport protein B
MSIVIAGNPNCGKTTLFNALTGLRYKVANYPGVTVERKKGTIALSSEVKKTITDLPGIYSLGSLSEDEEVATKSLRGEYPDESVPEAIIAVLDSGNLERNLYLLTQLIDLEIPIVVALTMGDLALKKGIRVHSELLSKELGLEVVPVDTSKGTGLKTLKEKVSKILRTRTLSIKLHAWKKYEENLGALDSESRDASARYQWIHSIFKKVVDKKTPTSRASETVDHYLTHVLTGPIIFALIMGSIFQAIFLWAEIPMNLIDSGVSWLSEFLSGIIPESMFRSLLIDGVIAGVGNVVVFVPQIAILFFLLGILEDTGYLSRAAYVMDRLMRPFGLQGRSFIPLLSSFACAIPGIMSARTIASRTDRLTTILIAPLMSCSARLPVYTVLIAACVPDTRVLNFFSLQGLVLLIMYLLGVVGAALVSWILKMTILRGTPSLFLMEMPGVRMPVLKTVFWEAYDRVGTFLKSAGTIILACSVVLWFLASFPAPPENLPEDISPVKYSFAGYMGRAIEPVIKPLGFNWEIGVAIIASFAAREVFISALATIYTLDDDDNSGSLISLLKKKNESGVFTTRAALSLMVFYVFACQCMSTLAICRKETGSWSWVFLMFAYMSVLAYGMSYLTYNGLGYFGVA